MLYQLVDIYIWNTNLCKIKSIKKRTTETNQSPPSLIQALFKKQSKRPLRRLMRIKELTRTNLNRISESIRKGSKTLPQAKRHQSSLLSTSMAILTSLTFISRLLLQKSDIFDWYIYLKMHIEQMMTIGAAQLLKWRLPNSGSRSSAATLLSSEELFRLLRNFQDPPELPELDP